MRFKDKEIEIVKSSFSDFAVLMLLRKVFLFAELSDNEIRDIKRIFQGEVLDVVKKVFYPQIEFDAPIGQIVDLWTVETLNKSDEETLKLVRVRSGLIGMLKKGLSRLEDPDKTSIYNISFDPSDESITNLIWLSVRNAYVVQVESQLSQLRVMAGMSKEDIAKLQADAKKDSAK